MQLPKNVSDAIKRLNPDLYRPVPAVSDTKREQNQRGQGEDQKLDKSAEGMEWRVTVISLRAVLVDEHDNLRTGCKPLVDQITASLGFASDDNARLHWEYRQLKSKTRGTIVMIERL